MSKISNDLFEAAGPLEKIAKYIDANGRFLDELITSTQAAAILQEAGRLAGAAPVAEEHLRQAAQAYAQALEAAARM